MRQLYNFLGWAAMVCTPLAAAILFGRGVFQYLSDSDVNYSLSLIGGIGAAVAIESIGIYAGHIATETIEKRSWWAVLPLMAIFVYVWIGASSVEKYGEIFIIAPFIYLLVALRTMLQEEEEAQQNERIRRERFERQQQTQKAEHQRKMQELKIRLRHEEKMQRNKNTTKVATKKGNKKELMQKYWRPGMGPTDLSNLIQEKEGVSINRSTTSRYINNGAMEHYQK